MEPAAEQMQLFHNVYLLCIGGMTVFFCISVLLFIRLHIRSTLCFFARNRGKRKRKTTKKAEGDFELIQEPSSMAEEDERTVLLFRQERG